MGKQGKQMRMIFKRKNGRVAYDHGKMIHAMLMKQISVIDEDYAKCIYENAHPKFVFSRLIQIGEWDHDDFGITADKFILFINSRDSKIMSMIDDSINIRSVVRVGEASMNLIHKQISEIDTDGNTIRIYKTLSPIFLKDLYFNDKVSIETRVKDNIEEKYKAVFNEETDVNILRVIDYRKRFCRVHKDVKKICGDMTFVIRASEKVHNIIQVEGVGSKTRLGFGFVNEAGDMNDN